MAMRHIGIILAGGQSRRMGTDKALLALKGETLLNRTIKTLKESGCEDVILSGYSRPGFSEMLIHDEVLDAGPVGGIVSSLKYLNSHYPSGSKCLFIAVDMPNASSSLIETLFRSLNAYDCIHFDSHPLPFCLRLSNATINLVNATNSILSATKSPSIRTFLSSLKICQLQPTSEQRYQLFNVNTPEAWQRFSPLNPSTKKS